MGNSDSKAKFRDGVFKLSNNQIPHENLQFWDNLWNIPTTAEEIFTLIQPNDVRMLRRNQPDNLSTMVLQAVSQLSQIVATPVPKYYSQAINCVRVLTRLVPFILEDTSDDFVEKLFFKCTPTTNTTTDHTNTAEAGKAEMQEENEQQRVNDVDDTDCTAKQLITAIFGLLFLPDFTVSTASYEAYQSDVMSNSAKSDNVDVDVFGKVYPSLLWCPGVAYPDAPASVAPSLDRNRKEVLKLLLTCFSGILYRTSDTYDKVEDMFLSYAVYYPESSTSPCLFPTLFYSLVNMVISYDPVGWGVPYAGSVLSDDRETLVDIALQTLLVLLDFGNPIPSIDTADAGSNTPSADSYSNISSQNEEPRIPEKGCSKDIMPNIMSSKTNIYRYLLSNIQRPEDLDLIFNGVTRLLNNYHQALSTYLPNSIKQIKCHQELLVLLWKLLDENTFFLKYMLKKLDMNKIVVPLLFLMYEGRKEPSKVGMIHICTFILLLLSGERDFGVHLNKLFESKLPLGSGFPALSTSHSSEITNGGTNHADFLIIVLHKVIVNGYEKLNSVYNCFLTIICNISPYIKKLNMVASVRLLRLFKLFAQPRYLYDNQANHHLVFFLLDTFNNIIQYQYEGNPHLIYAIVQDKEVFYKLQSLQMPTIHTPSNRDTVMSSNSSTPPGNPAEAMGEPEVFEENVELPTESTASHLNRSSSPSSSQTSHISNTPFVPTAEWVLTWKKKLPLNTTLRLLQFLLPQLDEVCAKAGGNLDERSMLTFLHQTTMVGLLPVPHPIVIRKYQPNQFTNLWFTTFTWGVIFLRNQTLPLFDGTSVTLFTINVL